MGYSIYQNHSVTINWKDKIVKILENFDSTEEAVRTFEEAERKKFQEGSFLYKINTFNNIEAIGQIDSKIQH
ncbi:MAG: hypothetical protein ACRBFS_01295 [Aureispira sp.]